MQNTRLDRRQTSSGGTSRLFEGPAAWLVTFVVIPGLLIAVLLLPPISLLDRLQAFTYDRIGANGGSIQDPDGTIVNFPAEGIIASFQAKLNSIPRSEFFEGQAGDEMYEAAQNLPSELIAKSPVYQVELRGQAPANAIVTIPIPNDSLPYETLSLYEWTGETWQHLPSTVLAQDDKIESRLGFVPAHFMVVQTSPAIPAVTLEMSQDVPLPTGATVTNEARPGLRLRGDGGLEGQAPPNTGSTMPIVSNLEDKTVRTDLINNLLVDPCLQDNPVMTLEKLVCEGG